MQKGVLCVENSKNSGSLKAKLPVCRTETKQNSLSKVALARFSKTERYSVLLIEGGLSTLSLESSEISSNHQLTIEAILESLMEPPKIASITAGKSRVMTYGEEILRWLLFWKD